MFLNSFEVSNFLQTLAMIHSIEMINNSTLLSGVKLGYEIYDTCIDVTEAMAAALRFLSSTAPEKSWSLSVTIPDTCQGLRLS